MSTDGEQPQQAKEKRSAPSGPSEASYAEGKSKRRFDWKAMLRDSRDKHALASSRASVSDLEKGEKRPEKWSMGILNDKETDEVPGRYCWHAKTSKLVLTYEQDLFSCYPRSPTAMNRLVSATHQPGPPHLRYPHPTVLREGDL